MIYFYKRFILIFTFLFFTLPLVVFAEGSDFFVNTEVGSSAGTLRIANIEGFSPHASNVFENPAGLYRINKFSTSAFMTTIMQDVLYQNLALCYRLPIGVLGFGHMQVGVDNIHKTREVTDSLGLSYPEIDYDFGYKNSVSKISYQVSQSQHLHLGASFSYFFTSLDTVKGQGYNMDVGAIFKAENFEVSVCFKNILSSKIAYTDSDYTIINNNSQSTTESIPFIGSYGLKYMYHDFDFYVQLKNIGKLSGFSKSVGVCYIPSFFSSFMISAGYKEYPVKQMIEGDVKKTFLPSAVLGLGLDLYGINFDYAYEVDLNKDKISDYKNTHYFSVAYSF